MAITKIQAGALPADVITTAAIDDASVTHAKLHTTMDLSSKTVTLPTLSTLNTTGNVGIGTSSPARQLSIVDDGTNGQAMMEVLDSTNNNVSGIFLGRANNTNIGGMRYFHATDHLALRSNDVDALIINSTGNVGIGETVPLGKLHVKTASSGASADASADELVVEGDGNAGISILSGQSNVGSIYFGDAGVNWDGYIAYSQASRTMTLGTAAGAGSVTINSTGNVGIGTSTPPSKLSIEGDGIAFRIDGTANTSRGILFRNVGGSAEGFIQTDGSMHFLQEDAGKYIKFSTANTERMRIDSSGRLTVSSVGTDTTLSGGQPGLQVTGSGFNGYIAAVRRDSSAYSSGLLLAKSRNSSADSFTALQDNDKIGSIIFIGDDGTDLDTYGAMIQAEVNGTPSNNNMPADLIFSTNSGTSTITERMRIDNQGRVTTPNQPAFSYLGSKSYDIPTTSTIVMSSANVWSSSVNHALNKGNHFNASTGRFTAPVAGTYHFQFQCTYSDFGSGYLWFYMNINGSAKSYMQASQQTPHSAIVHHMYCDLAASDYVDCSWTNNYNSGNIHYPGFSGRLVG